MKMPELGLPAGVGFHCDDSAQRVAEALASRVASVLRRRLVSADRASLVVSGGTTPVPFFQALAGADLDWSRVDVVLADERWVPEDDPASNAALVKQHLMVGAAANAHYLALKQPGDDPEQGLGRVREVLATLSLPLDVVILGMGNDGHTASLFPDAPELAVAMDEQNKDRVVAMSPASQRERRVTLTRALLQTAGYTALHLRGEDKLTTLGRACRNPSDVLTMPVRAFLKPGLDVFWSP